MAISKEQQFAEKLHAYTVPRPDAPNSRVKDLAGEPVKTNTTKRFHFSILLCFYPHLSSPEASCRDQFACICYLLCAIAAAAGGAPALFLAQIWWPVK
jgi:hypothetical protein